MDSENFVWGNEGNTLLTLENQKDKLRKSKKRLLKQNLIVLAFFISVILVLIYAHYTYSYEELIYRSDEISQMIAVCILLPYPIKLIISFLFKPLINILDKKKIAFNEAIENEIKSIENSQKERITNFVAFDILEGYIDIESKLKKGLHSRDKAIHNTLMFFQKMIFIFFITVLIWKFYASDGGWIGVLANIDKVLIRGVLSYFIAFPIAWIFNKLTLAPIISKKYSYEDEEKLKKEYEFLRKCKDIILKLYPNLYIYKKGNHKSVKDKKAYTISKDNLYEDNLYEVNLYEENLYEENLYEANSFGANSFGANSFGANSFEANSFEEKISNSCNKNNSNGKSSGYVNKYGNHYDENWKCSGHTDKNGDHYDANWKCIGHTDKDGNQYDENWKCIGHTDKDGNQYDENWKCIGHTDKY